MSRPSKHVKRTRGQATVEFALALPIFALAFFAIVEFAHLFYVKLTMQSALREAGRYMVTGQGQDPTDANARKDAIQARFCQYLLGTGLTCPELVFQVIGDSNNCGESEDQPCKPAGGAALDTVIVTVPPVTKPFFASVFRFFDPDFPSGISLSVSTTWQNEPFPAT